MKATRAAAWFRGGLPAVLSQTFRALIQSRMQVGMAKYEKEYPAAGMMLVEPNRNDEQMFFFTNIFSYASRAELVDHAYQTTRAELLARADELEPFLAAYDLGLNRRLLETRRSFHDAMRLEAPLPRSGRKLPGPQPRSPGPTAARLTFSRWPAAPLAAYHQTYQ